ncbi:MAG: DUF3017 domain-containing protein [Labedaea sp.]
MVVVAIGLVRIALYHWREGTVLIGGALLLAAALRALLSDGRIGMVAIRGRGVDVLLYGCLGIAVLAVSLTIQGGPLNQ